MLNKDDGGEGGRVVLALLWSLRDKDNCGHFDKAKIEAFRTSVSGASGDEGHEWYDEVKLCEEFREGQGAEFVLSLVRSMEEGVENDVGALSATTMGYAEVGMLWNLLDVRAMMSMQEFFHLLQQSSEEVRQSEEGGTEGFCEATRVHRISQQLATFCSLLPKLTTLFSTHHRAVPSSLLGN